MKVSRKNIVIIEDNEPFALLVTHYIKNNVRDVNVFVENTAQGAINSIHKLKPSLVVLDYYLEDELSGKDVMVEINKMNPRPEVILLSSIKDGKEKELIMKMGIKASLPKENEAIYDLVSTIQQVVNEEDVEQEYKTVGRGWSKTAIGFTVFGILLILILLAALLLPA